MTRLLGPALGWLLLVPALVLAQAADATLTGTAKDASGGVMPGVTITVRNQATNEVRSTVSSTDGLYRLTNLPRGTYQVKFFIDDVLYGEASAIVQ